MGKPEMWNLGEKMDNLLWNGNVIKSQMYYTESNYLRETNCNDHLTVYVVDSKIIPRKYGLRI